jgi:probable O-glycosylation ligase (exosortase A-associated)
MITEALFLIAYLVVLPIAFMFPFAGALAYEWLQYMPPGDVYNAYGIPNMSVIVGGIALIGWAIKDKKEMPSPKGLLAIFILYALWVNVAEAASIVNISDGGHDLWTRAYKTLIFTIALSMMARTQQRIEAFLWVVCMSIGNFVIIGAVKTILSGGGGNTVIGAGGNILGERVSFAIAVTTIIPLIRYLRDHATLIERTRRVRIGLDGLTIACILATVGSQARTGFVSLGVLAIFYFIKSKRKLMFILLMPILAGLIVAVAPAGYFDRMQTISNHEGESSAQGRLDAWAWGWKFALQHPVTGGGFHSFLLHQTGTIDHPSYLEAHNTFVETLADHGFPGLILFLLMIFGTIINCQRLSKRAKKVIGMEWAANLGTMLQLAMWTWIAGAQFLHAATQSMPYEICALSLAARGILERRLAGEAKSVILQTEPPPAIRRPAVAVPAKAVGRPAVAYGRRV